MKPLRYWFDVLRGRQHSPIRRLDLIADSFGEQLQLLLGHTAELIRLRGEADVCRGSVLCLGQPLHSEQTPRAFVASKGFRGKSGEVRDDSFSIDLPLARPVWIVAIGRIELVQVSIGPDVQHVSRGVDGPVCIVDQPWELGRMLRVTVRFT